MTAFKNDVEYSQLVLHTAAVLQSNKFMQVRNPTKAINQAKGVLRKWSLGCKMETKGLKLPVYVGFFVRVCFVFSLC